MKIVAAPANHHGSGYHRVLVPLRALAVRGHQVILTAGPPEPAQLDGADVLYLPLAQSESMYALAAAYRARGGRVLYEIDDDYRATPATNPAWHFPDFAAHVAWMNRIIALADGVVVATPALAAAYRDLNARIFVCPNAIDPADVARFFGRGEPDADGELRIGWAGSQSHYRDLELVVEPLTRIFAACPNLRLVMLGADFRRLFPARFRERIAYLGHTFSTDEQGAVREFCFPGETWPVLRYYEALARARLHVGLAPLAADAFNDAKSALKLLEYGALGIPAVASDAGPYRDYARSARTEEAVLLAGDAQAWEAALVTLLESPPARARLRRANRANVLCRHLIYHHLDAWQTALDAVLAGGVECAARSEELSGGSGSTRA